MRLTRIPFTKSPISPISILAWLLTLLITGIAIWTFLRWYEQNRSFLTAVLAIAQLLLYALLFLFLLPLFPATEQSERRPRVIIQIMYGSPSMIAFKRLISAVQIANNYVPLLPICLTSGQRCCMRSTGHPFKRYDQGKTIRIGQDFALIVHNAEELASVIIHEQAHYAHRDVPMRMILTSASIVTITTMPISLPFVIILHSLILRISEYAADHYSAEVYSYEHAIAALTSSNILDEPEPKSYKAKLRYFVFATHPLTSKRIARLKRNND